MTIQAIELFAGAGGLAMGMSRAGVRHQAIVEWNKDACDTLRRNRGAQIADMKDWPEVIEADVQSIQFSNYSGVDLVAGGPPCQPFSLGGKHRAFLDQRDMFPSAVRAVREARPRAFVFENVRGLVRTTFLNYFQYILLQLEFPDVIARSGEEWLKHLERLERHKTKGGESEYRVVARVLNAANFGVPQRRERVFIVGVHKSENWEFSFPPPTHSQNALLVSKWITSEYWDRHRIASKNRPPLDRDSMRKIESLSDIYQSLLGAPWRTVRDAIDGLPDPEINSAAKVGKDHKFQPGARAYPGHTGSPLDEPAKALKAGDHGVPGGENMLRRLDGSVRYFTVRESARIQTFPDDFSFSGSWTESMRQLGNAVPVDLAACVAQQISEKLRNSKRGSANVQRKRQAS
jgi:DNA (cytosine-5)-methyltransferase 1